MIRKVRVNIPFRLEGKHLEAGTEMLMEDTAYRAMQRRERRGRSFISVIEEEVTDPDEAPPEPKPKAKRKPRAKAPAKADA